MRLVMMLLAVALAATGCGDDDGPRRSDAGPTDAGAADAGGDTGAPGDAGPEDGGADASMPGPLAMARDDARMRRMEAEMAFADVPAAMRIDPGFMTFSMNMSRTDAIIGEEGLVAIAGIIGEEGIMGTRSLSVPAVAAYVIAGELMEAIAEAEIAAGQLADHVDPETVAVHDALVALVASLETLRSEMLTRVDELITMDSMLATRDDPEYGDDRKVHLADVSAGIRFIVEGRSVTDPTGALSVDCGMFDVTVDVRDEETGATVFTGAAFGPMVYTLPGLRVDDPNLLHIAVSRTDAGPGWGAPCTIGVTGRRRWRGASIPQGAGEFDALMLHTAFFDSAVMSLERELNAARSATDPDMAEIISGIERVVTEVSMASGRWRSFPDHVDEDDLEVIQLTNLRVLDAVLQALQADPHLARPELPTAADTIGEIRMQNQTGIGIIGP